MLTVTDNHPQTTSPAFRKVFFLKFPWSQNCCSHLYIDITPNSSKSVHSEAFVFLFFFSSNERFMYSWCWNWCWRWRRRRRASPEVVRGHQQLLDKNITKNCTKPHLQNFIQWFQWNWLICYKENIVLAALSLHCLEQLLNEHLRTVQGLWEPWQSPLGEPGWFMEFPGWLIPLTFFLK